MINVWEAQWDHFDSEQAIWRFNCERAIGCLAVDGVTQDGCVGGRAGFGGCRHTSKGWGGGFWNAAPHGLPAKELKS